MMIAGVTGDVELEGIYEMLKPNYKKEDIGEVQTKITNAGSNFFEIYGRFDSK